MGIVARAPSVLTSIGLAGLLILIASQPAAAVTPTTATLTPVAGGFDRPVLVTHAGDASGRLFVVEQSGRIKIVQGGVTLSTPFLDISDRISLGGERGLLGLAFHPSYETNHRFFVYYTRLNGDTVVDEYRSSTIDPNVAPSSTARRILTVAQPYSNHNGGHIAFGRDGYLYIGLGDGGGSGDPGNRAQRLDTLLGKLLRIDINGTTAKKAYRVPRSNPYVGRYGLNEIWARGLRNPWRWSFDRATGDLWIGDVGQNSWEEVDRAWASKGWGKGKNYGWHVMEGFHCYAPASGCNKTGRTLPLLEYSHSYGCSVTGGYVYRGPSSPALYGRYVFGDYCSGRIWTVARSATKPAAEQLLVDTSLNISSFGEDEAGGLYVVDHSGGTIYRLTAS